MPTVQPLVEIGRRIKKLRGKHTRAIFAEQFLVPPSTLARWETGESQPDLGFLVRLSGAFGISIEWIVTGNENAPKNGENQADHQLAFLDKIDWIRASTETPSDTTDSEKPATCRRSEEINTLKYIDKQNSKPATVACSAFQDELNSLNKELRELMRENATILRENGDLRVDLERKKARIAELERELARLLKGDETPPVAEVG